MVDVDKLHSELLAEYSTTIDASTLLAILSDYDLAHNAQLSAARQILDILKESVSVDEQKGFEPSATAGGGPLKVTDDNAYAEDGSASARSLPGWTSFTDDTTTSQELSSLDLEGLEPNKVGAGTSREESPEKTYTSALDGLDDASKEKALVGIFPSLKQFDIKWTLKKCKWDASLAIDELMTQSFLEESGTRHRGIEAFSENDTPSKPRKGKGKKKKPHLTGETRAILKEHPPLQSKWDSGRQDVEFLSEKMGIPIKQISFLYHKKGASTRGTISAIIQAHRAMNLDSDDPMTQISASELQQEFPGVSLSDLEALLQITRPSITAARDLAKALASRPAAGKVSGIQIEFRHKPFEDDSITAKAKPRVHNAVHPKASLDFDSAIFRANNFHQARDIAHAQASAAYRKGKSDNLMGGAAAYYSQVSRDLGDRARSMESVAANALVAGQSSKIQLDLHGINVKDALRISRERVTNWWHELGESKASGKGGVGANYRIVTGVGKHSEGGRGKLGPAVGKMLIREGWKVEVGSGVLVVTGITRRR